MKLVTNFDDRKHRKKNMFQFMATFESINGYQCLLRFCDHLFYLFRIRYGNTLT